MLHTNNYFYGKALQAFHSFPIIIDFWTSAEIYVVYVNISEFH